VRPIGLDRSLIIWHHHESEHVMRRHIPAPFATPIILLLALIRLLCGGGPSAFAAPPGSPWNEDYFTNTPLVTQDGKTVHFYDDLLKGKAVAINLIYTSCTDVCPLETARLAQVQKLLGDRMGKEIFFYSISIDPKHDSSAVLKAYAEKFQVGPGWLFLTGKQADIALISKKLGLSSLTDVDNSDGHLPSLMIGNEATGQWMRNSAVDNPKFLAVTMRNFLGLRKDREAVKTYAEAPQLPAFDTGANLFRSQCSACHTIGKGDGVGPDLLGVTQSRERGWLARFIKTPERMLAEGDPIAVSLFAKYKNVKMPNLRLGDGDVAALLTYLDAQTAALQTAEAPHGGDGAAHTHEHTHPH
jgi:protein SCO1